MRERRKLNECWQEGRSAGNEKEGEALPSSEWYKRREKRRGL